MFILFYFVDYVKIFIDQDPLLWFESMTQIIIFFFYNKNL